MKKKLWILVAAMLLLVQLFSMTASADGPVASGTCGSNLSWELNELGTLTISGTGTMTNYFPGLADISALTKLFPSISGTVTPPWSGYTVTSVVIEKGVTSIGSYAFYNNSSLLSVSIPEGVTTIGIAAFANCTSLTTVSLPKSLKTMGVAELSTDTSGAASLIEALDLKILGIPVTTIAKYLSPYITENASEFGAFTGCSKLVNVSFSQGLTSLGVYAFSGCKLLTNAVLPASLTSVSDYAFHGCSALLFVNLKAGCLSVGSYAFNGCKLLSSMDLPSTVTSIGEAAFAECSSLSAFVIPESIVTISKSTFNGCSSLKEIVIPQSVNEIAQYAFKDCSSLNRITFESRPQLRVDIDVFSLISGVSLEDVSGGINDNAFSGVTADAYYYIEDDWSGVILNIGDARKNYGGTLTWKILTRHEMLTENLETKSSYKASKGESEDFVFQANEVDHNVLRITLKFGLMYGPGAKISVYDVNNALVDEFNLSSVFNREVTVEGSKATVRLTAGSLSDAYFNLSAAQYTYYVHSFEDVDLGILNQLNLTSKEATCTENGYNLKHCAICDKYVQDKIAAKGHDFGSVDYQWSEDHTTCTATRTCKVESCKTVETETVNATVQVTQEHSAESDELTVYTAVFENEAFEKQVSEPVITKRASGWFSEGNKRYYKNEDGTLKTGWFKYDGVWYYMGADGAMQTGWIKVDGKWYYIESSGAMKTGWLKDGGKWYYLNANGAMATGWAQIGGKWYYFNASGAMQTGWIKVGGKWYYMENSGAMKTGWFQEGGKWYYLNSSGAMATGWAQIGGKWYYFNTSGVMQTGWLTVGGKTYYLGSDGAMKTGRVKIGSKYYTFGSDGALIS